MSDSDDEITEELVARITSSYQIDHFDSPEALESLCLQMSCENSEIVLIGNKNDEDFDLFSVIQMKVDNALRKGNELIVMIHENFKQMIAEGAPISHVNKLSFLHHGEAEFGYVKNIKDYIDHMPNLNDIVLRGCGTAAEPKATELIKYKVKVLLPPNVNYDKKAAVQGEQSLVLRQKEEEGQILTKATWATIDKITKKRTVHEIIDITGISLCENKKPNAQQLKELSQILELPGLNYNADDLRKRFFDPAQSLEPKMLDQAKKVMNRAKTMPLDGDEQQKDLLSKVLLEMTEDQKDKVSVKAYVSGYGVCSRRVIPYP